MHRTFIMTAAIIAGTAQAATLDNTQLDGLLTGNTLYLDIPAGNPALPEGGTVPFLFAANGKAAAKLNSKLTLIGSWSIGDNRYCVDWDNGPKNSCTVVEKRADGIALLDASNGEMRGTVNRIVPLNPENL